MFLCWIPVGHAQCRAFLKNFFSRIKPFLARPMILSLLQNNFLLPLSQHSALRTSLVVSLVLLLLYVACSLISYSHISCISVQISGKTYSRSLHSCPSLGKRTWLSPWSEERHIWDLLARCEFKSCGCHQSLGLVISFCMTMVDEVFNPLCPWLFCYLTTPIYLCPNDFQPWGYLIASIQA